MTKNDAVERASIRCEHGLNKEICPMLHDDEPMKNDNPPSTGLLLALDDLWGDMNPRNDYETCRAKYEGLRAGIEALQALQTSRPDADRLAALSWIKMVEDATHKGITFWSGKGDSPGDLETCEDRLLILETIRAALKSVDKGRWQNIESAPRDMTEILLYIPNMQHTKITMGRVNNSGTVWRMYEDRPDTHGSWTTEDATHWQPLPLPPTSEGV